MNLKNSISFKAMYFYSISLASMAAGASFAVTSKGALFACGLLIGTGMTAAFFLYKGLQSREKISAAAEELLGSLREQLRVRAVQKISESSTRFTFTPKEPCPECGAAMHELVMSDETKFYLDEEGDEHEDDGHVCMAACKQCGAWLEVDLRTGEINTLGADLQEATEEFRRRYPQ
jgi:hypothetical protein